MNARIILSILATVFVTMTVVTAGGLIWLVTAEPEFLVSAHVSKGVTGVALAAVSRALSLFW